MATSLPRRLNPDTGEWEVVGDPMKLNETGGRQPSAPTQFGAGSTSAPASGGPSPLPPPPPPTTAPAPPNTGTYNPNPDFIQGNLNPQSVMPTVNTPAQPSVNTGATPTVTANPWDALTGAARANDLGYINSEIDRAYQEFYGRKPTAEERDYWVKKATTPDTYTGGNIHKGWNPYLYSRVNPANASGSSVNPGTDTIIGYDNGPSTRTPINFAPSNPLTGLAPGGSTAAAPVEGPNYGTDVDPFASLPGGGVRLASGAWVPAGHPLAEGAKWNGAPPGTSTSSSTTTTGGNYNNTSFRQAIQNLLNTPNKVNPQELMDSSENQAFNLAQQRNEERQRAQIAERNAATGRDQSGGEESGFAGLRQARGEQQAQFVGQLAITRMQQQREDLVQGITFAMADQQFEEAQALKEKLAALDRAIQQMQIESTARTEANKLSESGRQYDLGLGFNYTELQAKMRQAAMETLLGGSGGLSY